MASFIERIKNIPVHMFPFAESANKLFYQICSNISDIADCLDFDGQRKAERIFQTIIGVFACIGLVIGFIFQQFSYTVYTLAVGFILSCLITLPPWPMYRQKPLQWQKPRDEGQESSKTKKKK